MKITKKLLLSIGCVLAVGYGVYTTARIRQLDARLRRPQAVQPAPSRTYAFDDSFKQHFGQRGVTIVEGVLSRGVIDPDQIHRELSRPQTGLRYEVK